MITPTYPWIACIRTVSTLINLVILVPKTAIRAFLDAMSKLTALDHNCGSYRFFNLSLSISYVLTCILSHQGRARLNDATLIVIMKKRGSTVLGSEARLLRIFLKSS